MTGPVTADALDLRRLTVSFPAGRERQRVVHDLDLVLRAGTTLGIVGESGSGKSVTLRAIMGLLPATARVESGRLSMNGSAIPLVGKGVRASRRRRIAMVFQDPLAALDPVMTIGDQIAEVPRRVFGASRREARDMAVELLRQVQIPQPEFRAAAYAHELSGGQRQRAVIAMALATRPQILLCDEPTTALDVTIQAEILDLLRNLRDETGLTMVFVSHDLAVVSEMADDILVMRDGRMVEAGNTAGIVDSPHETYTRALMDSVLELPPVGAEESSRDVSAGAVPADDASLNRLQANGIRVTYGVASDALTAVDGVDLSIAAGRIHGLVGESGSGKTTLAKVLTGQTRPSAGTVMLDGERLPDRRSRPQLRAIQMIYQDPYSSLDPRMTVRQTLGELLRLVVGLPKAQLEGRCRELLDLVSMPGSALDGYPGQFSGGQRQRIAIARALAVQPSVLIADEPTSALDVSIQAAVLELLVRLRDELNLTLVVISHNLAVIRHICDSVSVMYGGRVIEAGSAESVLDHPAEDYTRALIEAVPRLRRDRR